VRHWFKRGDTKAVSLLGIGGVGKSTLAKMVAVRNSWQFPGGIIWVSANQSDGFTVEHIFQNMDMVWGSTLLSHASTIRKKLALDRLNAMACLLIIDDLDRVPASEQQSILELLDGIDPTRGSKILLTARQRVTLFDPVVSQQLRVKELDIVSARQFLEKRAIDTVRAKIKGHEDELAGLARYHPLMLSLTLTMLYDKDLMIVKQLLRELKGEVGEQVDNIIGAAIQTVVEQQPQTQKVLETLSVFTGRADRNSLSVVHLGQVATEEDEAASAFSHSLELLSQRSIIDYDAATEKYTLHPLIRDYMRLSIKTEAKVTLEWRHAFHYMKRLPDLLQDVDWFSNVSDAIRRITIPSITDQIEQRQNEELENLFVGCAQALAPAIFYRFWGKEGVQLLEMCATTFKAQGRTVEEARMYNEIGDIYRIIGEHEQASVWYLNACRVRKLPGQREEQAQHSRALIGLGDVYYRQGWFPYALTHYEKGARYYLWATNNYVEMARIYNNIAEIYDKQGYPVKALRNYKDCLKNQDQLHDYAGMASTHRKMGQICWTIGKHANALDNYKESIAYKKILRELIDLPQLYGQIGIIFAARGEISTALENFKEGIKIAEQIGDQASLANLYNSLVQRYSSFEGLG
jgi:tetratricopeptide (TPR) repeat protein